MNCAAAWLHGELCWNRTPRGWPRLSHERHLALLSSSWTAEAEPAHCPLHSPSLQLSSSRCAAAMADKQSSFAAAIPPPSITYAAPIRLHLSRSLLHCPLASSSSTLARRRCSSPPGCRHASLSALAVAAARPPRVATNRARAWNGCGRSLPSWHGAALIVDALRTTSVGFRPSVRPPTPPVRVARRPRAGSGRAEATFGCVQVPRTSPAHPPPPTSLLRSATASPACFSALNSDQGPRTQI